MIKIALKPYETLRIVTYHYASKIDIHGGPLYPISHIFCDLDP
jgi:hypothetical protein